MDDIKPVYQDIEESPFSVEYNGFTFYFSSAFYQRNFKLRLPNYIREEEFKLKNRYRIINERFFEILHEVLAISLYKKIEKRGFRVYKNDEIYNESGD